MSSFRRQSASVNAGSMADIAFLLLIFFLVTTTISAEKGVLRQLPPECLTDDCGATVLERNILRIHINSEEQIRINDKDIELEAIKDEIVTFVNNNGNSSCNYCNGKQLATSSEHPTKAVISLNHHALTSYGRFISVQDEISKAYNELRNTYAIKTYEKRLVNLNKTELESVKKAYPFIVSEVLVKR